MELFLTNILLFCIYTSTSNKIYINYFIPVDKNKSVNGFKCVLFKI